MASQGAPRARAWQSAPPSTPRHNPPGRGDEVIISLKRHGWAISLRMPSKLAKEDPSFVETTVNAIMKGAHDARSEKAPSTPHDTEAQNAPHRSRAAARRHRRRLGKERRARTEQGPATDPSPSEEAPAAASAPPRAGAAQHRSPEGDGRDRSPTAERPTSDAQGGQTSHACTEREPETNPTPPEDVLVVARALLRADETQPRQDASNGSGRSPTAKRHLPNAQQSTDSATADALTATKAAHVMGSDPSLPPRKMSKPAGNEQGRPRRSLRQPILRSSTGRTEPHSKSQDAWQDAWP